ncbi:unnamed protein product [Dovyalis caffra]|uniref:Gamma-glutamyltranspeptidase n=1 Tax=Dovyalis caffra TaxID=77055 RepID=A0AAV1RRJ4_9ROSI|nr:unnamed protein product [Dovyalis caffra]
MEAFYKGPIRFNLVRDVQKLGGILTVEDLQRYQVRHAFAMGMNLGDPDFANVTQVMSDTISPKFAEELKKTIYDNRTFDPVRYGGRWNQIIDHGTSHTSIVDSERNAVSMTSTVNAYFGAQILNDTGNVPPPAPPNFIRAGKRPLSSMTPTIVLKDEKLKGVVGASGGAMIIAGTTEVLLNHFAKGMDPLSSVLATRVYHQDVYVHVEAEYPIWDNMFVIGS